jgi:hypothetical protein
MSTEPLTASHTAAPDGSERGLLLAVLLMVVLGAAGMLFLS